MLVAIEIFSGNFAKMLGCHGNFSHLKKAGLNRLDKIGFFQTIFEKTHRKSKISQQPKFSSMFSFFFFLQDTRAAVLPFVFLSKTYTEGINSLFFLSLSMRVASRK